MRAATITDKHAYLRADLIHRQRAAELEKFLHRLKDAAFSHPSGRLLIYAHLPRATLKIDKFHGTHFIELLSTRPEVKVALVATHREVQLAQQYVEAIARMKRANIRTFPHEAAALAWLLTPAPATARLAGRTQKPPRSR